jgi:hypothetical protein
VATRRFIIVPPTSLRRSYQQKDQALSPQRLVKFVLMNTLRQYVKRASQQVVAVQLDLQTSGFTYENGAASKRARRVTGS